MSKKKKFIFPDAVLDKINECSNGGYILFILNEEGLPEVFSEFDDPTKAMALQYYIDQWSKALNALNVDLTAQNLMGETKKNLTIFPRKLNCYIVKIFILDRLSYLC